MGIALILAQVILVVSYYMAHIIHISLWIVWLPAILFGALWILATLLGGTFRIDSLRPIAPKSKSPSQLRKEFLAKQRRR